MTDAADRVNPRAEAPEPTSSSGAMFRRALLSSAQRADESGFFLPALEGCTVQSNVPTGTGRLHGHQIKKAR
jgi:hypothetical protein